MVGLLDINVWEAANGGGCRALDAPPRMVLDKDERKLNPNDALRWGATGGDGRCTSELA